MQAFRLKNVALVTIFGLGKLKWVFFVISLLIIVPETAYRLPQYLPKEVKPKNVHLTIQVGTEEKRLYGTCSIGPPMRCELEEAMRPKRQFLMSQIRAPSSRTDKSVRVQLSTEMIERILREREAKHKRTAFYRELKNIPGRFLFLAVLALFFMACMRICWRAFSDNNQIRVLSGRDRKTTLMLGTIYAAPAAIAVSVSELFAGMHSAPGIFILFSSLLSIWAWLWAYLVGMTDFEGQTIKEAISNYSKRVRRHFLRQAVVFSLFIIQILMTIVAIYFVVRTQIGYSAIRLVGDDAVYNMMILSFTLSLAAITTGMYTELRRTYQPPTETTEI